MLRNVYKLSGFTKRLLSTNQFHIIADGTLESINSGFERLMDMNPDIDTDLGQGVLTLNVPSAGTYVINKQPPVKQIWLSSPISGPKKFDFNEETKKWVNQRGVSTLSDILTSETLKSTGLELELEAVEN